MEDINIEQSTHFKHVETIYKNYLMNQKLLNNLLSSNADLADFVQEYHRMFGKNLVVLCANFFELFTLDFLPNLLSDKETTRSFLRKQALNRKYHSLFKWGDKDKKGKEAIGDINPFLSLFGKDFRKNISKEIDRDATLDINRESFLYLGTIRNRLVHEGFKEEVIFNNVSVIDIWNHFLRACDFYRYILNEIKFATEYTSDYHI